MSSSSAAPVFAPHLAIALHRQLASNGGNLVLSPLSVTAILAIALVGAREDTAREIETVLGLTDGQSDVHAIFAGLLRDLLDAGGDGDAALTIASRIWTSSDSIVEEAFEELVRDCYRSDVAQEDFRDRERVAHTINVWVETATRGRIRDLVSPSDISEETTIVFANAVYFLGMWETPFSPSATHEMPFWLDDTTAIGVPMMSRPYGEALYSSADGWEAIELPYRGGRLVMDLVKPALRVDFGSSPGSSYLDNWQSPRLRKSLEELEATWSSASFSKMVNSFEPAQLMVSIPRFDLDTSLDLSRSINQLGIKKAFHPSEADFSGAIREGPAWIGLIQHRCRLRVDEQGTEAAAATSSLLLMGFPPVFIANHPFLFVIRDTSTGAILFTGRVSDPTGGSGLAWDAGKFPAARRKSPRAQASSEAPDRKPWWRFW